MIAKELDYLLDCAHLCRGNQLDVDDQLQLVTEVNDLFGNLADQDSAFSDILKISCSSAGLVGVQDDSVSQWFACHDLGRRWLFGYCWKLWVFWVVAKEDFVDWIMCRKKKTCATTRPSYRGVRWDTMGEAWSVGHGCSLVRWTIMSCQNFQASLCSQLIDEVAMQCKHYR
jgi:hypothetical protein